MFTDIYSLYVDITRKSYDVPFGLIILLILLGMLSIYIINLKRK